MKTPDEFYAFHKDNPLLYEALVRFAREAKSAGIPKCGIRLLWERARWFFSIEVKRAPGDTFRLNDWYKEYYARLIMKTESDLRDFFEVRVSVADSMFEKEAA